MKTYQFIALCLVSVSMICCETDSVDGLIAEKEAQKKQTDCDPQAITVTYTDNIKAIMTANCAVPGCHVGSSPSGGVRLESFQEVSTKASRINTRINSSSNPMPPGSRTKLTQQQKDLIAKWIAEGLNEKGCDNVVSMPDKDDEMKEDTIVMMPKDTTTKTFNIWKGSMITFTKADNTDPTAMENQDKLSDNVIITRGDNGGQIYNIVEETKASQSKSPEGTEWAVGTTENISSLEFKPFRSAVGQPKSPDILGKDLVVHLIKDDVYLDLQFTSWSTGKKGGFGYTRSSP